MDAAVTLPLPAAELNFGASSPSRSVTILAGNALEHMAALPSNSIDCVWTDPPYLLSNGGITCYAGKRASVNKGAWDSSTGLDGDLAFHERWVRECARLLRPGGSIWVSGTVHVYPLVIIAMRRAGLRILNDIVWEKPNPPPNLGCRCFTHSTEIIIWAAKGRNHTFHYSLMRTENGGKQMKTVWRMAAPTKAEKSLGKHPTQKPVPLVARCLRACTKKGDMVLDPFAGSGTTGVAARQGGRNCILIEREPEYIKLAHARLRLLDGT